MAATNAGLLGSVIRGRAYISGRAHQVSRELPLIKKGFREQDVHVTFQGT